MGISKVLQSFMGQMTSILLTGGTGYIGSHTFIALREAGLVPIILDDFSNSHPAVLERLQRITGQPVQFRQGNVADVSLVKELISREGVSAVVHFAGFKSVSESVLNPLAYYENNVGGLLGLLKAMAETGCRTLIFSSSATVYGDPDRVPIKEDYPRSYSSPYGHTKLICEDILSALRLSDPSWRTGVLRYFNPVGAHPSGLIGEDPLGLPNNLMPYVAQVAVGRHPFLKVFGNDYDTPDGTGVRDYIHVQDLAESHVAALQALLRGADSFTVNVGTSRGYSVLDVVRAFEVASGRSLPYQFASRRKGDIATCYAEVGLAQRLLGWRAERGLAQMCADAWRWQSNNPDGYRTAV
jgi:UDP-glucose 4-epimerase